MKQTKGPEFIRFFRPILELLLESGGTGTPSEIVDHSLEIAKVSETEQQVVNKNGQSRVKNQVHWARQYLVWGGYLDSSKRGVWSLTDKGRSTDVTKLNPIEVFKSVQKRLAGAKQAKKQHTPSADEPKAKKEARRDGVPPIELVDGEVLVDMFERLELGLIPTRTYDIDERFFDDYRK